MLIVRGFCPLIQQLTSGRSPHSLNLKNSSTCLALWTAPPPPPSPPTHAYGQHVIAAVTSLWRTAAVDALAVSPGR